MPDIVIEDKNRLDSLRRKAARRGYRLSTSRWRYYTVDNYGGVMLIKNYNNIVEWGDRFSLTLDEVDEFLNRLELESALR
jgi:hypothetical protein